MDTFLHIRIKKKQNFRKKLPSILFTSKIALIPSLRKLKKNHHGLNKNVRHALYHKGSPFVLLKRIKK